MFIVRLNPLLNLDGVEIVAQDHLEHAYFMDLAPDNGLGPSYTSKSGLECVWRPSQVSAAPRDAR